MKNMLLLVMWGALLPATASAAYQYYYPAPPNGPDPLTSINTNSWFSNGSVSTSSNGYTSTDAGGLVSKVASPTGGSVSRP